MKHLQIAAVFMILLIVNLPIIFAQELSVSRFSGSDGIQGFARRNDVFVVESLAHIVPNVTEDIAKQRLRIFSSADTFEFFDSCVSLPNLFFRCNYSRPIQGFLGSGAYRVSLVDANDRGVETVSRVLSIDSLAPEIKAFNIDPPRAQDKVFVSYEIEDYASQSGNTTLCSGIKEINFLSDGAQQTQDLGGLGVCSKRRAFEITRKLSLEQKNICIQAIDIMGQASRLECRNFTLDSNPPVIYGLVVTDSTGFNLSHVRSGVPTGVNVRVRITGEDDVLPEKVLADFSGLNPSLTGQVRFNQRFGDEFVWSGLSMSSPESCQVTVFATDSLGNPSERSLQCNLPLDNRGPSVEKIETLAVSDDSFLLARNGTITVTLKDLDDQSRLGGGLRKNNVFLNLDQLGLGTVKPDVCDLVGDVWKCVWRVIPRVGSGQYSLGVTTESRDDLDNPLQNPRSFKVDYDSSPPAIRNNSFSFVHIPAERPKAIGESAAGAIVKGDTIELRLNASGFDDAFANASGIGSGVVEGNCQGSVNGTVKENFPDESLCIFNIPIDASGPFAGTISLDFFDRAKNKASFTYSITVAGIRDEENPNHWVVGRVECSPQLIDRSVTSLHNFPVSCRIHLSPKVQKDKNIPVAVEVAKVVRSSIASELGLRKGDVITVVNGVQVKGKRDFDRQVRSSNGSIVVETALQKFAFNSSDLGISVKDISDRPETVGILLGGKTGDYTKECTGDCSGVISDVSIMNTGVGSSDPFVVIRLASQDFKVNNVSFSFPISIYTKQLGLFTSKPEFETVKVTLNFYSQPLGELAQAVDDETNNAIDKADSFLKWIGQIQKFIDLSSKLCTIKASVNGIISTIDGVITFGATLGAGLSVAPPTEGVAKSVVTFTKRLCAQGVGPLEEAMFGGEGLGGLLKGLFEILDLYCGFLNCKFTYTVENLKQQQDLAKNYGSRFDEEQKRREKDGLKQMDPSLKESAYKPAITPSAVTNFVLPANALIGPGTVVSQLCEAPQKWMSLGLDPSYNDYAQKVQGVDIKQMVDVKESIVWSTLCLCIPGVLYNLNKWRQIECKYATCMAKDVRDKGVPLGYCKDERANLMCNYVIGQAFLLFPLAQFFDQFLKVLKESIANPLAAVAVVAGLVCGGFSFFGLEFSGVEKALDPCQDILGDTKVEAGKMIGYSLCKIPKVAARIGDAIASIQTMKATTDKGYFKTGDGFCEGLEDLKRERSSSQTPSLTNSTGGSQ